MGDVSHTPKWLTSREMLKIGEVTKWCVTKHFIIIINFFHFVLCEKTSPMALAEYGGTGHKFCRFHKRGLLPTPLNGPYKTYDLYLRRATVYGGS